MGVTGEVTAGVDPRGVPRESQAKIGAGPTPIETDEGWLVIYHGVLTSCNGFVYSMGAALLDLEEPWRVIARAPGYLLSPRHPRVVGVLKHLLDLRDPIIREHERDRLLVDLPLDSVRAASGVDVHRARRPRRFSRSADVASGGMAGGEEPLQAANIKNARPLLAEPKTRNAD